jgi:hypothetical protein
MSNHLVARNARSGAEVLCIDPRTKCTYWRNLEIGRALGHPTAMRFTSHKAAWRAADMHGGIAICETEHAARAALSASYTHPNLIAGAYTWKPSASTFARPC